MAFCAECGHELSKGARFCSYCGTRVAEAYESNCERRQVFEGIVHKCPHCGETVSSFQVNCPSCGFEFRDTRTSSTVKSFAAKLEEIENRRPMDSKGSKLADFFGYSKTSAIDQQKITLIRSFSIPNTKEDILEFIILASSNIDVSVFNPSRNSSNQTQNKAELDIVNAWIAKLDQAYEKAKLIFGTQQEFEHVQEIYLQKKREIKKAKFQKIMTLIVPIVLMLMLLPMCILPLVLLDSKGEKLDKQLNSTVAEIQIDIANGDYDSALFKANTLYYDSSYSSERAADWDKQREAIIEIIIAKKTEENQ